jgi:ATP-dependent helicase YprA (DUF1998 family)
MLAFAQPRRIPSSSSLLASSTPISSAARREKSPTIRRRPSGFSRALKERGKWPAKPDVAAWFGEKNSSWADRKTGEFVRAVTLPDDSELLTRHEVQVAPPDLLVTNYSMLEYMLMRPIERTIFDRTREWRPQHA